MFTILAALSLAAGSPPVTPPLTPTPPASSQGTHDCAELAAHLDSDIIASAETLLIEAKGDMPPYCRVMGVIKPSIGFEMRLPLEGWNGKYYQSGCGGFCGALSTETPGYANGIVEAVKRGYAAINTDSGHPGKSQADSAWALGNPEAVQLYAHKWLPLAHAAGHSIIQSFYGSAPSYSYLVGCSNGGRVGLMAAQRYPTLFNGIIVGCPAVNLTQSGGAFGAWKLRTNNDLTTPILTKDFTRKLPTLIAALNAQCDAKDGQVDGLIAAPFACKVNYRKIPTCKAGVTGPASPDNCLTKQELAVVRAWHEGPKDSKGKTIFYGMPIGGEQFWKVWYLQDPDKAVGTMLADGFTRHIASDPAHPGFSAANFDFDQDPARLARDFAFLDAADTDLSPFQRAGGKLIMWHGMADPLVVPQQTTEYYDGVAAKMGGVAKVQSFFRFFLAPGLGHCWELPSSTAPEEFDPLTAIENWAERGIAPEEIVATPSKRQGDGLAVSRVTYRPYPLPPIAVRADDAKQ